MATDYHDALISEIHGLRKSRARWKAVAIASLALVFMVLIPFTMSFWWLVRNRESSQVQRARQYARDLEIRLGEEAKARRK